LALLEAVVPEDWATIKKVIPPTVPYEKSKFYGDLQYPYTLAGLCSSLVKITMLTALTAKQNGS
jgi:hypothetical protein